MTKGGERRADSHVRKAQAAEAPIIYAILAAAGQRGEILPRSQPEVAGTIDQWQVAVQGSEIVGCGSLHSYNHELAEIRSLVVVPGARGMGIGGMLATALIEMAIERGRAEIFVLTRRTDFFGKFEFMPTRRERFPEKMRQFCRHCPKRSGCNERALFLRLAKEKTKTKRHSQFQVRPTVRTSRVSAGPLA